MLHQLVKLVSPDKKRVGRGTSSGKGKTSGRGQKGQKSRNSVPWFMTGGSRRNRFSKSIPMVRGWKNRVTDEKAVTVPMSVIVKKYNTGDTVNLVSLVEKGVISKKQMVRGVKVVNSAGATGKFVFEVPVSKTVNV